MENGETIIISDRSGIIILSTEPSWKGFDRGTSLSNQNARKYFKTCL